MHSYTKNYLIHCLILSSVIGFIIGLIAGVALNKAVDRTGLLGESTRLLEDGTVEERRLYKPNYR